MAATRKAVADKTVPQLRGSVKVWPYPFKVRLYAKSTTRANMPVIRILLIALALWIVFRLIKKVIGPEKITRKQPPQYEDMVTCVHCGLHLPRSEAIEHVGKSFCSSEHAQQHKQDDT